MSLQPTNDNETPLVTPSILEPSRESRLRAYEQRPRTNVRPDQQGHCAARGSRLTTDYFMEGREKGTYNVSKTFAGAATKYVIGDTVRKNGQAVKYKLSRRGHAYLREVLTGHKKG